MDYILLFLSLTIGTLHHARIVSAEEQSAAQDAIDLEKLYKKTFSDKSIHDMAVAESRGGSRGKAGNKGGYSSDSYRIISPGKKVYFYLFTRSNPKYYHRLEIDDVANLDRSPFNSAHETKVLIHGWMGSISDSWTKNMTAYYLNAGDYNVIAVDWKILSTNEYKISEEYTQPAGEHTAKFLRYLKAASGMSFDDVEILGLSFGVLVAGFTGADMSDTTTKTNVTDPAGPLYEIAISNTSNNKSRSFGTVFVDIFHTCTELNGSLRVIGQLHFYPDEETCTQPDCILSRFTIVCENPFFNGTIVMQHNHSIETILQTNYLKDEDLLWADVWI